MENIITFEAFHSEWLRDILEGNPSTVELGNRFARKLITQWLDVNESTDDMIFCDGSGDGGIDVACLNKGESSDDSSLDGDTWYLVQSKYGSAFTGLDTLLREAQKVIDTLDGQRKQLSSLTQDVLERLAVFRAKASERDKLVLVFATENALNDDEKRVMNDIRAMGKNRLGLIFDVEAVSIATIYQRTLEGYTFLRTRISLDAQLVESGEKLLVGSIKLMELYKFLKFYRSSTGDLDQLYEKNVRRFLGTRRKVNAAIKNTLEKEPERFGLYNNGVTIVVEDFKKASNDKFELVEPYIVNGCQTTRTIWDVLLKKLESGGTGSSPELEKWKDRLEKGMVILKIVKVGFEGEQLLTEITRYTNSQNAVSEKDFLALTSDFKTWAKQIADKYNIFLEIQRGGWDSQRALQSQNSNVRKFSEWTNAFDLLKVYGSGWLGEAGLAFGKNPPFLPSGSIFKRIVNNQDAATAFGVDDLYAAFCLLKASNKYQFGRGAQRPSRGSTRFLFYMVVVDLLKAVMIDAQIGRTNPNITQVLLKIFNEKNQPAADAILETAIQVIDEYMTQGADDSIFTEPAYISTGDLNSYLKWEQLGKSEESSPKLRGLLAIHKRTMKRSVIGQQSPFNLVLHAIQQG